MSWFDEQLRHREKADNAAFADAVAGIAEAVAGKRTASFSDSRNTADRAILEILDHFGLTARKDDPIGAETLDDLLEFHLSPFGIMRRPVTLVKGWYRTSAGPMLGTLASDGSTVALIPGRFSGYSFFNPVTGKRIRLSRRNEKLLEPEAVCFYKPLPPRPLNTIDLLRFIGAQLTLADILLYIGMIAATSLLGLLSPILTKLLFGSVLDSGSTRVLLALACFMLGYSICRVLVSAFQALVGSRIGTRQDIAVQAAVMSRLMSLPTDFFKDYSPGELNRRASHIQTLCSSLLHSIVDTGLSSVFSLVYFFQIIRYAPSLVVPSLVVTLTTLAINIAVAVVRLDRTKEQMRISAETSGLTYSTIAGIQKIKLAGAEKRMFARWADKYASEVVLNYNSPFLLTHVSTLCLAVALVGNLLIYYHAYRSGIAVDDYYAFSTAFGLLSGTFSALAGMADAIGGISASLEMAKPVLEAEPELAGGRDIIRSLRGGIEISHVSFRYSEDAPNVIDDLSLTIHPGEYVAVAGETGCGKTTLMRLLLGFEKPQRGAIFYDGKDISRVDLKSLRRNIGAVMQDSRLSLGDVYSNITLAAPQLTTEEAWAAAETAQIADDIRAMPMGMHTIITEGQGGISGGQKQRLMIAQAIAPKPGVLLFDEATSALDNITQKKISDAIDSLHCTRIVIAHRLSTISACDRVIVLHDGRIAEDGSYDELIARNGIFADLVARQRLQL